MFVNGPDTPESNQIGPVTRRSSRGNDRFRRAAACTVESVKVMSASPTSTSINQTAEQRAHEPSMEEILASIRKIIADDQMLPLTRSAATAPSARPASSPSSELQSDAVAEVVTREEVVARAPIAQPAPDVARPSPSLQSMSDFEAAFAELRPSFSVPPMPKPEAVESAPVVAEVRAAPAPEPIPVVAPAPAPAAKIEAPRAVAQEETALVSASTGASVSSAFNALATTMFLQNTGMVEEAMRDMLRPMLKQWLDDNLPTMVERLVRTEIERVARGGR